MKPRTTRTALALLLTATAMSAVPATHASAAPPTSTGRAALVRDTDKLLKQLWTDGLRLPASMLPAHEMAAFRNYNGYLRTVRAVRNKAAAARTAKDVLAARTALQHLAHLPGTGRGLAQLLVRADTAVRADEALLEDIRGEQGFVNPEWYGVTDALNAVHATATAAKRADSSAATVVLRLDWSSPRALSIARASTAAPLTSGDSLRAKGRTQLSQAQDMYRFGPPAGPPEPTFHPAPLTLTRYEVERCAVREDGRYDVEIDIWWTTKFGLDDSKPDFPGSSTTSWRDQHGTTESEHWFGVKGGYPAQQDQVHLPELAALITWSDGRVARQVLAPARAVPISQCT